MSDDYALSMLFIAALTVCLGSFVQTVIGFGMAVIAAPILFFLNPEYVPGPIIFAALFNCLANVYRFRSSLSISGLKSAIVGRIPGCIVGGGLLLVANQHYLAILIAVSILFSVVMNIFKFSLPLNARNLFWAGFASGVMGISTSIGGPPIALLVQGQKASFIRANLAGFFLFSCITSLMILVPMGIFTYEHLLLSLPLLPATLLGNYIAYKIIDYVNKSLIRYGTLCLCITAVILMLIKVMV
ncbi:sulfite exporter TauE/SafE family protein [Zooshikella harenae]|uniref:Probable membrane transporter protein n=1 Tax=Zooshikella harenae TaxID=2827238 RepID=A0ABS5ZAU7_9GAMM|nr:sulfite exporter TauE/SafE family protein [Zooshikella harenae]MBU2711188.1 sulfite exporter TauE/SafE family protein [Zooshikella harenae]